jgi:hypothetical protein
VRTTLTINDDIAVLLEQEVQRSGKPFKAVVNHLLSLGLVQVRQPQPAHRFQVKARPLGMPKSGNYDNIAAVLEELEGPEHR